MATLLLKLLVPAGYMIDSQDSRLSIVVCSGSDARTMTVEMPGGMPDHGSSKGHGKAEMPCAFSGLSAASLGAIDPTQFAALVAFVMAAGIFGRVLLPPSRRAHFRPPLRGPPASL